MSERTLTPAECIERLRRYTEILPQPPTSAQGRFDADIRRLLGHCEALEADNARLRAALRPFGGRATVFPHDLDEPDEPYEIEVTWRQLRAVDQALETQP